MIWCNSNVIGLLFHNSPIPQISHLFSFKPLFTNLFFKLKLLKLVFSCKIVSNFLRAISSDVLLICHRWPVKCEVSIWYLSMYFFNNDWFPHSYNRTVLLFLTVLLDINYFSYFLYLFCYTNINKNYETCKLQSAIFCVFVLLLGFEPRLEGF